MFRTIRNHWKKSLFAFCALSYGAKWSYDRHQANKIRQFYCKQATLLNSQTLPSMTHANRIAVLLNSKANNGKTRSIYDKTIFPLLHLTGLDVRVYSLDSASDPTALKELLTNKIEPNELSALVIVGGDGTISQLTPHLLESTALENVPICIVPIGEHVSFARSLFPLTNQKKLHDDIKLLCESVFALFNGKIVKKSLLKITMSNDANKPIYATTFEFGHYSRLEQLQKRLWYFSYLKYPISSIYHYLTTSLQPISSSSLSIEDSCIAYSNPCSGCLRCQPSLLEQYRLSQQEPKTSYFSRVYQSNRSNIKPINAQVLPPVENPDCGIEYCIDIVKQPIQLWAKISTDEHSFQIDITDQFERFNYHKDQYPKQTLNVHHIRFKPNIDLIPKQMLINHDKFSMEKTDNEQKEKENNPPIECRIELTDKKLKFIQINTDSTLIPKETKYDIEDNELEQKDIFLFRRRRRPQQTLSS